MSSTPCAHCLLLEPRISRWLLLSGGICHILAGVAVVVSSIPWAVKVGLITGVLLSLTWFGYGYGYAKGQWFITRAEWLDGRWRLETGTGRVHHGQLIGGYAHPLIVILNFQIEGGGRWSLTLLPDSADPDDLRRMRVWLKTQRSDNKPEPP